MAKDKAGWVKVMWVGLSWGTALACIVAMVQASGGMAKGAVVTLAILGALSIIFGAIGLGWYKAPIWMGTPIRFIVICCGAAVLMSFVAYEVWPVAKPAPGETKTKELEPQKPDFHLSVGEELMMMDEDKNTKQITMSIILMVQAVNRGAKGSLGGWKLHYHSASLDTTVFYSRFGNLAIPDTRTRKVWHLYDQDNIYEKTMTPVETGQLVRGWARFDIPHDLRKELSPGEPHPDLTLVASDYTGREYDLNITNMREARPGETKYWPGTRTPATN